MRREKDRERPLEAVLHAVRTPSHRVFRPDHHVARGPGRVVVTGEETVVASREDNIGIVRLDRDVAALAPAHRIPVPAHAELIGAAGNGDGRVVLLRAIDAIGKLIVHGHVIKLGRGLHVLTGPALAPVEGDVRSPVVGLDHVHGVVGIDPHVVVVTMRHTDAVVESLAPIVGAEEAHVEHVHRVFLFGVCVDVGVVPRPLAERPVLVGAGPGFACIIGAKDPAVLGFNDGPDAIGVDGRDGDADLSLDALGQALGEFLPGIAPIGGLVEAAARPAAVEAVRAAFDLPETGVHLTRVFGIHGEIDRPGVFIDIQNTLPDLAPIGGAIDAPLFIGTEDMAEGGDIDEIRILRMNQHLADLAAVLEADVLPGLSGIDGLVDSIAMREVAARAAFAHAGVDDIAVGSSHGNRTHGAGLERVIAERLPGDPRVGGLPHPAAGRPHVVGRGIADDARAGGGPPAPGRPDSGPFH